MIPILYPQSETAFTSNGIGRLADIISCKVTEERNGIFECEFEYPITGRHYSEIREGRIIYCTHDDSHDPQPFDIYSRSAPINGVVTFNARHISYRLRNIILDISAYSSCPDFFANLTRHTLNDCPFAFETDKTTEVPISFHAPIAVRSALGGVEGSALDRFSPGEYEWDKFAVRFLAARGEELDTEIRYAKNLTDLTYEFDNGDSYNAVVPYWSAPDGAGSIVPSAKIIVADEAQTYQELWTDNGGNVMTDNNGNEFEFTVPIIQPVALDCTDAFEEEPTPEELAEYAKNRLEASDAWLPDENLTVDFVQLWQTSEYEQYAELQKVKLCDTVTVRYDALGVNVRAKVIKVTYNVLLERYDEIELGKPQSSFADTLSEVIAEDVEGRVVTRAELMSAIHDQTDMIVGGKGGYIQYVISGGRTREILAMDTLNLVTAKYVLRINAAGIGFSRNGYKGPYTNAWTIDGVLSADWIKSGKLTSQDGSTYFDLENGRLFTSPQSSSDESYGAGFWNGRMVIRDKDVTVGGFAPTTNPTGGWRRAHLYGRSWSDEYDRPGGLLIGYGLPNEGSEPDKIRAVLLIGASRHFNTDYDSSAGYQYEDFICLRPARFVNRVWLGNFATDEGTYISTRTDSDYSYVRVFLQHGAYINGKTSINGYCNADGYNTHSDERLKNIWEWDDRYDALLDEIEPILYTWKQGDDTEQKHIGVSAQKMQKALNDAGVSDSGIVTSNDGNLAVSYTDLSMLLMKRVKDQQKRIDDLETRLARLEGLLNADK